MLKIIPFLLFTSLFIGTAASKATCPDQPGPFSSLALEYPKGSEQKILQVAAPQFKLTLHKAEKLYYTGELTIHKVVASKTFIVEYEGECILVALEDEL